LKALDLCPENVDSGIARNWALSLTPAAGDARAERLNSAEKASRLIIVKQPGSLIGKIPNRSIHLSSMRKIMHFKSFPKMMSAEQFQYKSCDKRTRGGWHGKG
jgi:hypothetical protein